MLTDSYARRFTYLRLSVTEVCNFRCNYCLPDGTDCSSESRQQELTLEEIRRLVTGFAKLGTRKVRITGGEPSLRKDLCEIIAACKAVPGIETVAITTNGYRLHKDLTDWRAAGLDALNVSVDSLEPARFQMITGHDKLQSILAGLALAEQLKIPRIKLNTVLMRGFNDDSLEDFLAFVRTRPVTLRFIELMRTGDNQAFFEKHHLGGEQIIQQLLDQGWVEKTRGPHAGPAREFIHPEYRGSIGLIMPYSKDFCASCNRMRVASDGNLFTCLFADQHQSLRDFLQQDDSQPLMDYVQKIVYGKAATHQLHQSHSGATRQLAMIGG